MKKLFVTDLDGTLLENHVSITEENLDYIKKLKDLKHCFAIATGRAYDHIEALQKQYNLDVDYYILLNGALILDKRGSVINHQTIPMSTIEAIVEEFYNDDWRIYFGTGFKSFKLNFEEGNLVNANNIVIEGIEEIKQENISMFAMNYKKEDTKYVDEMCKKINNKFGDKIIAYRNVSFIDIVPAGCSKGDGVDYIKEKERIPSENTFAIGDSWNDVSMFKSAQHSFTFKRAEKELQSKARYVVDTVAECIGKYILEDAS
ncbi:HAD family phosphatase [Clostridium sp. YIM B02515]|uniref:HAD family phosphatase n=1 Tax=Clostridium rhizosphaerae TaxID=2803861 RepID=A0ABS1T5A3_9CLOT|nr:HAD family hydrolase [Clostridium rhizosphaerae]MBL4934436.1 HAD family phosphatase [Clostridium rhizosphaerae]